MSVLFPKWMNAFPTIAALAGVGGLTTAVAGFWYYATPKFWEVGYMPAQPGAGFNHQIHAGRLGMDCRYCHSNVERSAEANIPSASVCFGCHAEARLAKLAQSEVHRERTGFVREAYAGDASIPWTRVHKLPDYVRNFPHDVHVSAGVSCFSCHGQILSMPVVFQSQSISMSWCLDCHRSVRERPEEVLVPRDKVTNLVWVEEHLKQARQDPGKHRPAARLILESLKDAPPENCGACHY